MTAMTHPAVFTIPVSYTHLDVYKRQVLGDEDLVSKEAKQKVTTILYNSDFEIITNKKLQIRNGSKDSITLIGLDSMINGNPNAVSYTHLRCV